MIEKINFCTNCGDPVVREIPRGDNRERHVCECCGFIQYQNPKIVSGCIPYWGNRVLLCKRAIHPRKGLWTIPAGYLEIGETIEQGARRETLEEACAVVGDLELYQISNLPRVGQIYMIFKGRLKDPDGFGVGEESLDVRLVEDTEIPWDRLAFRVIHNALSRFVEEHRQGEFSFQVDSTKYKW